MNIQTYGSGADEGYYLKYATYIAQEKGASLKALSEEYIENKEWHLFPSPLRAGHIFLSALWMKALNRFDFKALVYMSAFFSMLSLFVGYIFVRRLFDKDVAILSLVLFAVSPINLAMARRALQDGVVYFFIVLTLYLFYEALKKDNILFKALFALSFFVTVMVKESSVLLVLFFLIFLFFDKAFYNKKLNAVSTLSAILIALAVTALSYIGITGGAGNFGKMAKAVLSSPLTNEYAIKYQSGSLFRYMYDFLLISPVTLVAAIVFFIIYFMNERIQTEQGAYLVIFFIMFYVIFSFFSKNIRYVMALDLPIRVFTALAVWTVFSRLSGKRFIWSFATVCVIGTFDLIIFRNMFLVNSIYDPVTHNLLSVWKI